MDDLPRPIPPPGEWHKRGLCRWVKGANFFPERGDQADAAKMICECCAVRIECLEYATANVIRFGIWGGKAERERRAARMGCEIPRRSTRRSRVVVPGEKCPRCGITFSVIPENGGWLCLDCKTRWR